MLIRNLAFVAAAGVLTSSLASGAIIYGATNNNNLVQFNSSSPGAIDSSLAITGLGTENVLGIDIRPATGQLYAVTNASKIYTVDTTTGAATLVGAIGVVLNGTAFGFDFNQSIDRIRIVSETDRNYVVNPITGAIQLVATNLNYGPADPNFGVNPNVTASAYNVAAQLYGIDTALDILVTQANNTGTLGTVGPLGVNASATTGFDVDLSNNVAYASLLLAGESVSNLYTINLLTGAATNLGQIDGGLNIVAMTVAQVPEPTTLAVLGGAAMLVGRRRRA